MDRNGFYLEKSKVWQGLFGHGKKIFFLSQVYLSIDPFGTASLHEIQLDFTNFIMK
jgi:hypothetical protein